jgi:hypothetical protein
MRNRALCSAQVHGRRRHARPGPHSRPSLSYTLPTLSRLHTPYPLSISYAGVEMEFYEKLFALLLLFSKVVGGKSVVGGVMWLRE